MEDNKQVNFPSGGNTPEEEKKKKPLAGLLLGKTAMRSKWGIGSLAARLVASKTAIVGLALGVTALAGLATMTLGDREVSGGGYGEALAFKPYESYSIGNAGAKDGMLSFPYANGNKEYTDELYKASMNPDYSEGDPAAEYEAETAETEASTMEGGAAGLKKSGGLSSAGGGSGKAGGGAGSKNAAKNASAANAAMKGSSSQAKGVAANGNAARAANSVRNQGRGAHGSMKTGGLSSDMNKGTSSLVPTALEARKSAAGAQFGEERIVSSGVGAGAEENSDSTDFSMPSEDSYFEVPDEKDDTSGLSSSAPGMSGATATPEDLAKMTEELTERKDKAEELLEELIDMAKEPDKLCPAGYAEKIADIDENANDMLDLLEEMNDAGYMDDTRFNNWRCNVIFKMKETVHTFANDRVVPFCKAYLEQKAATEMYNKTCSVICAQCYDLYNVCANTLKPQATAAADSYNNEQEVFASTGIPPVQIFEARLGSVTGLKAMLNAKGDEADSCPADTQKD